VTVTARSTDASRTCTPRQQTWWAMFILTLSRCHVWSILMIPASEKSSQNISSPCNSAYNSLHTDDTNNFYKNDWTLLVNRELCTKWNFTKAINAHFFYMSAWSFTEAIEKLIVLFLKFVCVLCSFFLLRNSTDIWALGSYIEFKGRRSTPICRCWTIFFLWNYEIIFMCLLI